MHFLPFFVSCSLAFLWERMNQFQHISLMLNLIPPFSPVLVHSEAPLHSSQTPKWRCECTGAWPCRHWRCRPTCPTLVTIYPAPCRRSLDTFVYTSILKGYYMILWWFYIWFYDSVHLCLFWFTMKGRGKHSHAGRDLAIHPSRSFSAGAMCSHAFRMLRVSAVCKGVPYMSCKHLQIITGPWIWNPCAPGCRIVDTWFSCISVTGWTDHWDDTELVVCCPGSNWN